MSTEIGYRAVVLGGSMAGLLAARALADCFAEVTVVDRDDLGSVHGPRKGVPQGRHAHALLCRGHEVVEELFPGLTAELVARGVPVGDALGDVRLYLSGHRLRQAPTGLVAIGASRPCLEDLVRARVRRLPAVTFAPPADVAGLVTTRDGGRVTGVRVLRRADGSPSEVLDADFVVDATGRGSRAPVWLESLGYARPAEERVRIGLGYATRRFRLPDDALDGDMGSLQAPTPDRPRGGVLARLEDGKWLLTLAGVLGDHPPTDTAGFAAFTRSLPFPDIGDAIRAAEPVDDPVPFRFPASVRRRYDRLPRIPERFLPLGDSVCSLNPIYGQGMTVAALQASALRRHLVRHGTAGQRRLVRDVCRVTEAPWNMVIGGDLAFPGVGDQTRRQRAAHAFITRLHAAAEHDERLATAFVRVSGLVDPPAVLLRPGTARRVFQPAAR